MTTSQKEVKMVFRFLILLITILFFVYQYIYIPQKPLNVSLHEMPGWEERALDGNNRHSGS